MFAVEAAASVNTVQKYNMTSATNVLLSTFLSGKSALTYEDIEITIPASNIIGGTVTEGLDIDDVSAYNDIQIFVEGDIQGAQGEDAVKTDLPITLINEGTISGDIGAGADAGTSNVTLHVKAGGRILAGGGNGGAGGVGGNGDDYTSVLGPYFGTFGISCLTPHTYMWIYGPSNPPECGTWWNSVMIFNATYTLHYKKIGSYWYFQAGDAGSGQYYISRGTAVYGTGGAGGAGGQGQGYSQTLAAGAAGAAGTWRSGAGGQGGNGGDWGEDGVSRTATRGGTGYYINEQTRNNARVGAYGAAGTAAGIALELY